MCCTTWSRRPRRVRRSRAWDIGGPDVLEYGEMMQIYADVAGLHRRMIVVLPLLTPTIASWWVGLVTPIPSGLARPLVESLHYDAVMDNHDIDAIIPPPPGGLTRYPESVSLALKRITDGTVETSWSDAARDTPSEQLPSDPAWAGAMALHAEAFRVDGGQRSKNSGKVVENSPAQQDWRVKAREPGRLLRLHKDARIPGEAWLQMQRGHRIRPWQHVPPAEIFYPRGIAGCIYWYAGLRWHRKRFREGVPRRARPGGLTRTVHSRLSSCHLQRFGPDFRVTVPIEVARAPLAGRGMSRR